MNRDSTSAFSASLRATTHPRIATLRALTIACGVLLAAGCASVRTTVSRPGLTRLPSAPVVLPAEKYGSYLVLEVKWDKYGPYHFLVDTGSSVTLVTPDLARRYGIMSTQPPATPDVVVSSASGGTTTLPSVTVRRIELGNARFDEVPALIYDCEPLSIHLGVRIDGILGFPLFRETELTLDYPRSRILLAHTTASPQRPGTTVQFNNPFKVPLIPVRLGDAPPFIALVDSGSDAPFSFNPFGLQPKYAVEPRPGGMASTLTGDEALTIARLADTLRIGDYSLVRPIVQITDDRPAIGGAVLQNFTVTFDQANNEVTFYREAGGPLEMPALRHTGLSFSKTAVYWRVAQVVPGSPAAGAAIQKGDLIVRINGEQVAQWDLRRYDTLVSTVREITYTFLNGNTEKSVSVPTYELVP